MRFADLLDAKIAERRSGRAAVATTEEGIEAAERARIEPLRQAVSDLLGELLDCDGFVKLMGGKPALRFHRGERQGEALTLTIRGAAGVLIFYQKVPMVLPSRRPNPDPNAGVEEIEFEIIGDASVRRALGWSTTAYAPGTRVVGTTRGISTIIETAKELIADFCADALMAPAAMEAIARETK